jgi:hypothetical protein
MTGPEHYRQAELLLEQAEDPHDDQDTQTLTARAQVHATLALAAATAQPHADQYVGDEQATWQAHREWAGVL